MNFVSLERGQGAYFDVLYSQLDTKVPPYIKEVLKQLQTRAGELKGEHSAYFIRAPNGEIFGESQDSIRNAYLQRKQSEWFNVLKIISTPPDDDDDEIDLRDTITRIKPNIQEFDSQNVYETLEEVNVVDFCCDFMKEQIKKLIISIKEQIEKAHYHRLNYTTAGKYGEERPTTDVFKLEWWEDDLDNMDCTELNELLDAGQADIVLETDFNFGKKLHLLNGTIREYLGAVAPKTDYPIFVDTEGRLHIDITHKWDELKEGATQGVKNTQPRTLAEVYEECLLTSKEWFEDPDSELSDDLRGKYSKKPGTPGERTLDEIGIDGRNIDRTRDWRSKVRNRTIDRWQPE